MQTILGKSYSEIGILSVNRTLFSASIQWLLSDKCEIPFFLIASYIRISDGAKCPERRIKDDKECKAAASELKLSWAGTWHNPADVPGCIFANDGRSKVYFNTALNAKGSNKKYAEICKEGKVIHILGRLSSTFL